MSRKIFRQNKHQIMGLRYSSKKSLLWVVVFGCSIYAFALYMRRPCPNMGYDNQPLLQHMVLNGKDQMYHYDKNSPFIFIGGMPRSGTTLARVLLDAHPDIRCGEETRVVPRLLQMRAQWYKSPKETVRLEEAGVFPEVLNNAVGAFIVEVMARHGEPAARLCNKDPFTMKSAVYLSQLFPNAKFILMVRDGRATVHSIISRKVTITGFDLTNYRSCMQRWNQAIQTMYNECKSVGSSRCMMVYYEQLVLHPKQWLEKIMSFLQVPWDDVLLHHEELINKPGGISLSKVERSSDQVVKPINIEALSKWVGAIPEDVVKDMADLAPMLAKLGYDPKANPPNYGDPDGFVSKNTFDVIQNQSRWQNKTLHLLKPKKEMLSAENAKLKEGHEAGEEKSVDKGEP